MTATAASLPPSDAAAHALVDDLDAPVLDDDAHHHLTRVRRLRAGSSCTVSDGRGSWRSCVLTASSTLAPTAPVVTVAAHDPEITIAFALTKGNKPETVVQKLTELGVDRIVPFRADHSVVRWDERKAATQHARWVAIARGAVEQSRGVWLPAIDPVADLDAVVALGASRLDRNGAPPSVGRCVVAVGPEGGWSEEERTRLPDVVSIGENVLRAETAALTAGAVLAALRSDLVRGTD